MDHWAGASTFFTASVFLHLLLFLFFPEFSHRYSHHSDSTDPKDVGK
jgi:hypothetical protein